MKIRTEDTGLIEVFANAYSSVLKKHLRSFLRFVPISKADRARQDRLAGYRLRILDLVPDFDLRFSSD